MSSLSTICQKHIKHIEAYCTDDCQLLCINCILHEGHKGHQFQSLEDSVKLEYSKFVQQSESALNNQAKVIKIIQQMSALQTQLDDESNRQSKEVSRFFNCLRTIVNEREAKMHETITLTANGYKMSISNMLLKSQQQLQDLNEYLQAMEDIQIEAQDSIQFLSQQLNRNKLLTKIAVSINKPEIVIKLPELNKETETNLIIKTLLSTKTSQKTIQKQPLIPSSVVPKKPTKETTKKLCQSKKIPLGEMAPNTVVQINLKKKVEEKQAQPVRLTNFMDARNYHKERNYEKSVERRRDQSTPRRMLKNMSKNFQEQSPFNHKSTSEQLDNPHEDSMKQELGVFLNSVQDFEQSEYNNMSHLQIDYQFITIGGFVDNLSQIVEKYDMRHDKASEKDVLQSSRCKFGAAHLLNGNILMMGGKKDGVRLDSCEEYNYKDCRVNASKIKLPQCRSGFGVLNVNQFIYVIGGNDGIGNLNNFDSYNQVDGQWSKCTSMIDQRDELGVAIYDNMIFAIGGFGGQYNTCLKSVEVFTQNRWIGVASLNVARRALSAVALPDGIYAIGGFDGSQYLNSVEKYDDGRWILIEAMNKPRCTLSAVTTPDNQYIYVFGGFDNGPINSVEKYSVLNGQWEESNPLVSKRFMHHTFIALQ